MLTQLYPTLLQLNSDDKVIKHHINNIIAATAEGYAFPTNLDTDLPVGGLAPPSQADLVRSALAENLNADEFIVKLQVQQKLKTET